MYSYRSKLSKEASYITRNFFMFTYKAAEDLERAGFESFEDREFFSFVHADVAPLGCFTSNNTYFQLIVILGCYVGANVQFTIHTSSHVEDLFRENNFTIEIGDEFESSSDDDDGVFEEEASDANYDIDVYPIRSPCSS